MVSVADWEAQLIDIDIIDEIFPVLSKCVSALIELIRSCQDKHGQLLIPSQRLASTSPTSAQRDRSVQLYFHVDIFFVVIPKMPKPIGHGSGTNCGNVYTLCI